MSKTQLASTLPAPHKKVLAITFQVVPNIQETLENKGAGNRYSSIKKQILCLCFCPMRF